MKSLVDDASRLIRNDLFRPVGFPGPIQEVAKTGTFNQRNEISEVAEKTTGVELPAKNSCKSS